MTKILNSANSLRYFFINIATFVKQLGLTIKHKYYPLEEYECEFSFNDTMRHCPKNADDLALIYATIYDMFGDIKDTRLFKAMISEMQYANLPSCKLWNNGNVMTLPEHMDAPFDNIITEVADRMSVTYWVLKYTNGMSEVIQPHQNRGTFRTGREIIYINDKPDYMPDNVVTAIQVTLGVVQTHDNILRGFQWKLYR